MSLIERDELWLVLLAVVLLSVAVTLRVGRWWTRVRGRRGRRRGLRGERIAERLLRSAGYRVIDRDVPGQGHVIIDGERVNVPLRADLLVERDGRRLLAEVKTGRRRSATIDTTRRQILEYALVFDVDGTLLVDAESHEIHEIWFDY